MSHRIILFSKRPREGAVKTRMVPPLTALEACDLHRALLLDSLAMVRAALVPGRTGEWRVDDPWQPDAVLARAARDVPIASQGPGDLGERLLRAFESARGDGVAATVILGSDAPTLPKHILDAAFEALHAGADAVVSPADDGGYVLIGARSPCPRLFRNIPWGGPDVLRATLAAATAHGVRLEEIPGWFDVDVAADLDRLGDAAPATARMIRRLRRAGRL